MRVLQLTDCHVVTDRTQVKSGVNAADALTSVVTAAAAGPAIDLVVLTGDLVDDEARSSYEWVRQNVERIGAPIVAIGGNHDGSGLRDVFPFPPSATVQPAPVTSAQRAFSLVTDRWRLLFLDSRLVTDIVGGEVDAPQLAFIEAELQRDARPTVAFVHHPPAPTGVTWIDAHGVVGPALTPVVRRHRDALRAIFFGHVHSEIAIEMGGVMALSCPATARAFGDGAYLPIKDDLRPLYGGARVIDLLDDGQLRSRTFYSARRQSARAS